MKTFSVGLDIGASCVKMAVFEKRGAKSQFVGFERYDAAADGVLSEEELYDALREFLKSRKLDKAALCQGIPQYQVTTSVADYPAARKGSLAQMVAMDTMQVCGLSEEAFVHGFSTMPPGLGRTCPVFTAFCREDGVRDCLARLAGASLNCSQLVPSGLALANACFALCKEAAASQSPALVLDIGRDNTLLAAVAGGQVLYVTTLMFSGSRFEDVAKAALSEHRSLDGGMTPLDYLKGIDLDTESSKSRFRQVAMTLESEIQNAVEHWRSQENDCVSSLPITKVYLTGGGSRMGGLGKWLEGVLECAVEPFAPEDKGVPAPELTVAYGLGLQGAGRASVPVSLIPQDVLWTRRRLQRWPFLAAAAGVLVLTCLCTLLSHKVSVALRIDELKERKQALTECLEVANRISGVRKKAAGLEKSLAMLAVPACRGSRITRSVAALQGGALSRAWLIYLGMAETPGRDGAGFGKASGHDGGFFDAPSPSGGSSMLGGTPAAPQEVCFYRPSAGDAEFICGGFAPEQHRGEVASLMAGLNGGTLFKGVDRGNSIGDTESELVWKWREYLNGNDARLNLELKMPAGKGRSFSDRFELFTLRLPFAKPDCLAEGMDQGRDGEE